MDAKTITSVWGAALSTTLGCVKLWEVWRNKPKVTFSATTVFSTGGEYGTSVPTEHGISEVFVQITVANEGEKPIQVFRIVIRTGRTSCQVESENLPAILQPGCRLLTKIQKEWIDDPNVSGLGMLSGTGRIWWLEEGELTELARLCRAMPSNRKQYVKRDDPSAPPVWAFQIRDASQVLNDKGELRAGPQAKQ